LRKPIYVREEILFKFWKPMSGNFLHNFYGKFKDLKKG
jgi:hypothetical protein